jgi:hypothetical protein
MTEMKERQKTEELRKKDRNGEGSLSYLTSLMIAIISSPRFTQFLAW